MKKRLCSFLFLAALYVFSGDLTLAENGIAQAGIVIPEKAKPVVLFAAKELKTHLDAMTGADFVVGKKPANPVRFVLDSAIRKSLFQMNM